jgi:hypothetical protein
MNETYVSYIKSENKPYVSGQSSDCDRNILSLVTSIILYCYCWTGNSIYGGQLMMPLAHRSLQRFDIMFEG